MSDAGRLVTLGRYPSLGEATMVKARLEAEGIEALVVESDVLRLNPLRRAEQRGVRVEVRSEDLEAARALLEALSEPDPDAGEPRES